MTVEFQCYVCGVKEMCIDGLCYTCAMRELWSPGAAFAATFGSLPVPEERAANMIVQEANKFITTVFGLPAYLLSAKDEE